MTPILYCFSDYCLAVKDIISSLPTIGTIISATIGAVFIVWKTLREFKNVQHHKRVEFTLAQHRRLFDDHELFLVLGMVDGDSIELRDVAIWNAKRKFLTFFEEIVLLRNSGYIAHGLALYMFGYYAARAHRGDNFKFGINYSPQYWNLFIGFAEEAEHYLKTPQAQSVKNLRL